MKVQCYAIFDLCSGIYERPFFSTADDVVRREFQDLATAADHQIARHPEHYSLYRLGTFDNTTGKMTNEDNECLWTAHEAIAASQSMDQAAMAALENSVNGKDNEKPTQL